MVASSTVLWGENIATFDNTGLCTNCILSLQLVTEAANEVDKDSETATPIDS